MQHLRKILRTHGGRRRLVATLAAAVAIAGVAAIAVAIATQSHPSSPAPSAAGTVPTEGSSTSPQSSTSTATPQATQEPEHRHLASSRPTTIQIPAIDVHSPVFAIGKDGDGGLDVPHGSHRNDVAWYKNSPTPGHLGPSVLEGHVDTTHGPSIFRQLGSLKPGNTVRIGRADGKIAVFTVNAVRSYPSHEAFPRGLVYGAGADLDKATLRLITCDNFNGTTGHYEGNIVVFAHLTNVQ